MALDPANFTQLVEQFVRGSIRRPTDTLGVRRTDVSFNDIQEAAAGTFLLYPQAPFYVLYLACQRVQELLLAEEEVILELLELFLATGRTVNPIKDLSPLSNMTAALQELERAIASRSQSFSDIEQVGAYKRFDDNVNRFLDAYGRNVKDGGDLVHTPQGARALIPDLIEILRESHDELVRRVTLIRQGLANYEAVNLPALSASGVISRSRSIIQNRTSSLAGASLEGRLAQNLDAVKELLAARALVRRFGSLSRPNSVFVGNITATPFSSSDQPAESGSVQGTLSSHITIEGRNKLDFFLNEEVVIRFAGSVTTVARNGIFEALITKSGGDFLGDGVQIGDVLYFTSGENVDTRWTVVSVDLTQLEVAGDVEVVPDGVCAVEIWRSPDETIQVPNCSPVELRGLAIMEGVVFSRAHVASEQPDNWMLNFTFDGPLEIYTNLVPNTQVKVGYSGDIHAGQLAESLNAQWTTAISPDPRLGRWDAFFPLVSYQGEMTLTSLGGGTYRATVASGDLGSVGVQSTSWYVKIMSGPDKYDFYKITAVDGSSPITYVDFVVPAGTVDTTNSQVIQLGKNPRMRLLALDQYEANAFPYLLSINEASIPDKDAAKTMGLFTGRSVRGAPIRARTMAEAINAEGTNVGCTINFQSLVRCSARTNPLAPTTLTLYKLRGSVDVVASGATCTFTLPDADSAQVEVGDYIVFRTSNPINVTHAITSKVGSTFTSAGLTIATQTGVEFDIGDSAIPGGTLAYTIVIPSGANEGNYAVQSKTTGLDFVVSPQLPQRQDLTRDPIFMTDVDIGLDFPVFTSKDTSTESSVIAHGSAGKEFFSSLPTARGLGTTPYLQLTAVPNGLQAGDIFEYYASDYKTPSETRTVVSVNFTTRVIEVDPETPSNRTYSISQDSVPPYALLRVAQVLSTNGLENKLQLWLDRAENGVLYFTDLNRFVNPLLANEHPTAVQVSDAQDRIRDLYKLLTVAGAEAASASTADSLEAILDGYSVPSQPQVETLLHSFKEKGADRAVDILLEADFTGFFGVDVDTSSYAGSMLKQLRELARDDLPIRKVDRKETQQAQLIAASEDEDFEFSGSDVEGAGNVPTG